VAGERGEITLREMTLLDRYVAGLRVRGLSDRTIENYCFGLRVTEDHSGVRFTRSIEDGILTSAMVWALLEDRVGDLSQAYLRQIVSACKSFHKWGNSRELWPLNGVMSIPSPKVEDSQPDPLSPSQIMWLLTNAATLRQKKLLFLGGWHGCRIHESAAMSAANWIDEPARFDFQGKRKKRREIPVAPALRDFPEFKEICTTPISLRGMRWAYESLRRISPFEWTPHQLRDTFSQRHLDNGVRLEVVEDLLGHAPRSTTLRVYSDIPWDLKVAAQRRLQIV
jgi:site-specific recombinase XerD